MSDELDLYQYEENNLIQLTDGRAAFSNDQHREGWRFREKIPATVDDVQKVAARSASEVLSDIEKHGYRMLARFEIAPGWRKCWTVQGRSE